MHQPFDCQRAKAYCADYRLKILAMSQQVKALHIAPAFSCLEMVEVIYHWVKKPEDIFLLSKGHGCLAQYILLESLGVLQKEDIIQYCTKEGRLGAHPDYGVPGISAATDSLGHGLGMAVGMAYANQIQENPGRVYAILSDGELQEGSTWEAVMMAANLGLANLVVCLDFNDFIGSARLSEEHPAVFPVAEKWEVFGWQTQVVDGHDSEALYQALTQQTKQPLVVIAHTIKGKGVSFMENAPIWHYHSPNAEEYQQAVRELSERL